MDADGEGQDPVKLAYALVIYYWPFQDGIFIVVLILNVL